MRRKLKEIRKDKNMTQDSIANMLSIHRTYYNRIENGKRKISLDMALKLKQILDYKEDDLFENH